MGAVRNHGNGLSDECFDANYFLIMVLLAYILNFINIWDGPFPTYDGILWFLERISLKSLNPPMNCAELVFVYFFKVNILRRWKRNRSRVKQNKNHQEI